MFNQGEEDVIDLVNDMDRYEERDVLIEADGNWIEFHFHSRGDYYTLSLQPFRGKVQLWSDCEQEKYIISE